MNIGRVREALFKRYAERVKNGEHVRIDCIHTPDTRYEYSVRITTLESETKDFGIIFGNNKKSVCLLIADDFRREFEHLIAPDGEL